MPKHSIHNKCGFTSDIWTG